MVQVCFIQTMICLTFRNLTAYSTTVSAFMSVLTKAFSNRQLINQSIKVPSLTYKLDLQCYDAQILLPEVNPGFDSQALSNRSILQRIYLSKIDPKAHPLSKYIPIHNTSGVWVSAKFEKKVGSCCFIACAQSLFFFNNSCKPLCPLDTLEYFFLVCAFTST